MESSYAVNVTTSPTDLLEDAPESGKWIIQNLGTATIYVVRDKDGAVPLAADVRANGISLSEGQGYEFPEDVLPSTGGTFLWACTSAGTADVRIMRVG